MSCRVLVVTLLLALGASAWAGIQLGDWLVQHAPQAAPPPGQNENNQERLDADGKPYVAQPPQPRVDGTLGVPEKAAATNWEVATVSLFDTVNDPSITLSRSGVTPGHAAELAAHAKSSLPGADENDALDSMAPAGTPSTGGAIMASSSFGGGSFVQNSQMPVTGSAPAAAGGGNWLQSLQQELAQCAHQGFFDRQTCAWNARNRYCGPNQAWGRVAECPQRP